MSGENERRKLEMDNMGRPVGEEPRGDRSELAVSVCSTSLSEALWRADNAHLGEMTEDAAKRLAFEVRRLLGWKCDQSS
jgi:hypothetical protein